MGSWAELDAVYPPGTLTPATALVVAAGHLAGARSVYAGGGGLAAFLPAGLGYDADLLGRAERYLAEVPLEQFLDEARGLLSARQRLVVALHALDLAGSGGRADCAAQIVAGLGADEAQLAAQRGAFALTGELELFPQ